MKQALSIGEVSARTGLATSAIRYYERRGLIKSVDRRGGKRIFPSQTVEQIAVIDLLKLSGFTLAEIADLIDIDGQAAPDWRDRYRAKLTELNQRSEAIASAQTMIEHAIGCPHDSLGDCPIYAKVVSSHVATLDRQHHS